MYRSANSWDYILAADSMGLTSTSLTQLALKSNVFSELTPNSEVKVAGFGANRKPTCNFLLVNNTNLHPTSHRLPVIADYWSNFRSRLREGTSLTHSLAEPLNS